MQCSRPRRRSTRGSRCPTRAACTCFASSRASVISLRWARRLPWLITAACFAYLGVRLDRVAAAEGQRLFPYLAAIFAHVAWSRWLTLMIPYCALFLLVDSLVVWRVTGWFNARLRYRDVLPIRASAYILSIVNEQVSKGAIALYLSRRHGIPAWEVGSSMLFIMFCEYYYLLGDRKSTRLNSSHLVISYAVFCLKKKKKSSAVPGSPSHPLASRRLPVP